MKKQTARIENWSVRDMGDIFILEGIVYGHPKLEDGIRIFTSAAVKFDKRAGVVETLNTFYTLGKAAPVKKDSNYN